jgi:hypothetical protein
MEGEKIKHPQPKKIIESHQCCFTKITRRNVNSDDIALFYADGMGPCFPVMVRDKESGDIWLCHADNQTNFIPALDEIIGENKNNFDIVIGTTTKDSNKLMLKEIIKECDDKYKDYQINTTDKESFMVYFGKDKNDDKFFSTIFTTGWGATKNISAKDNKPSQVEFIDGKPTIKTADVTLFPKVGQGFKAIPTFTMKDIMRDIPKEVDIALKLFTKIDAPQGIKPITGLLDENNNFIPWERVLQKVMEAYNSVEQEMKFNEQGFKDLYKASGCFVELPFPKIDKKNEHNREAIIKQYNTDNEKKFEKEYAEFSPIKKNMLEFVEIAIGKDKEKLEIPTNGYNDEFVEEEVVVKMILNPSSSANNLKSIGLSQYDEKNLYSPVKNPEFKIEYEKTNTEKFEKKKKEELNANIKI